MRAEEDVSGLQHCGALLSWVRIETIKFPQAFVPPERLPHLRRRPRERIADPKLCLETPKDVDGRHLHRPGLGSCSLRQSRFV